MAYYPAPHRREAALFVFQGSPLLEQGIYVLLHRLSADHHWGKRGRKTRGDAGELGESLPGGLTRGKRFFAPLTVLQDKERTVVLHIDRVASIIKLGGDAAVDIGARDEQVQFIERGISSSWRITNSSSLLLTLPGSIWEKAVSSLG